MIYWYFYRLSHGDKCFERDIVEKKEKNTIKH